MSNTSSLSKTTIALHWAVAVVIIGMLAVGSYMVDLPKGPDKGELIGIHKSIGFIVLILASLRVLWRLKEGQITPIPGSPNWQEKAAKGAHHLLLLATILMPVSGIMMSVGGGRGLDVFGVSLIAGGEKTEWMQAVGHETHEILAFILIAVIVLHVAGAVKHHLVDKDMTLKRMLGK
ncbi:cytochrome b [Enterovibrio sp. 27052020O]|uniref:cytochrome b n=1 Tax=Enterovibrio sp. 27052020O TaxID=3241166 RepID=UPI00388F2996